MTISRFADSLFVFIRSCWTNDILKFADCKLSSIYNIFCLFCGLQILRNVILIALFVICMK